MLDSVKDLAKKAQNIILNYPRNGQDVAQRQQLATLVTVYRKLIELIEKAEQEQATTGLYLLSSQLKKNSSPNNALALMQNFLNVLEQDLDANWDLDKEPHEFSAINLAKITSMVPFAFMYTSTALFLPFAVFSGLPAVAPLLLYFSLSTIPLAMTYYFDKPGEYSMSRLYGEISKVELILASLGIVIAALLALKLSVIIPPVILLGMISSLVVISLGTLKHSQILKEKAMNLSEKARTINIELRESPIKINNFFSHAGNAALIQTLQNVTLTPNASAMEPLSLTV